MGPHYLFGDTDVAAARLRVLAEVFAESSRPFLLEAVNTAPRAVVDLGCGPGYSTHFLADLLQCDRVAGLDSSKHFIALAQKTRTEKVSFYLHDVTSVPFPVGSSDLLYCRFLLTHLRDPQAQIAKWATQLRPEGVLLLEEVERIRTTSAVFSTYLEVLEALLAHQSRTLYLGPALDALEVPDSLKRRVSRIGRLGVPNGRAATMFLLNMRAWKTQPFVRASYSSTILDRLERDLSALSHTASPESEIEWELRQIAFERV